MRFYEHLRDLPPKEQERVLANDKRFQRLPPQRQQRIRENLRRWNDLSPQRKEQLREREEIFSQVFSSISSIYSVRVYLLPQSMQRRLTERQPKSSSTSPLRSLHFNPISICLIC